MNNFKRLLKRFFLRKQNTWDIFGESVIGSAHRKNNIPNQDAWIGCHFDWGDVVAVSDGLGSRPKSDLGAKAACESVVEAAKAYHNCPDAKIENILRLVHSHWLVKIAPFDPNECLATCLFVIRLNGKYLLAQLGDGLIAVCGKKGDDSILLNDSKQGSFSNLTYSLGQEFRLDQWQTRTVRTWQRNAVVLCTDGISDDLLPEKQSDFAQELYLSYRDCSSHKRTNEIYRWLMDWPVPGHSDDKTVACLFRKSGH